VSGPLLPRCEVNGCDNLADWTFIGEDDDLHWLCAPHGGKEPVDGWAWIGE
jgi:hypothetical protein